MRAYALLLALVLVQRVDLEREEVELAAGRRARKRQVDAGGGSLWRLGVGNLRPGQCWRRGSTSESGAVVEIMAWTSRR